MTHICTERQGCALSRRRFLISAGGAFIVSPLLRPARAQESSRLVLAFIPQENPEKLIGDIDAISAYLADAIGSDVRGFVTSDHAAAVEALRNGSADISFMGALPFVIAEQEVGAELVLSEVYRGSASYMSRVFVRRGSGIEALGDLRGKSIGFADPISESGYLYPLEAFVEAGLLRRGQDPSEFFGEIYFTGGYQQSMQAMANGLIHAAAASQYADLLLTPQQQAEVTWIAESKSIPSHVIVARSGLDPALKRKFADAMMALNAPENRSLLQHVYGPDGYAEPRAEAFEEVRALAIKHGLLDP